MYEKIFWNNWYWRAGVKIDGPTIEAIIEGSNHDIRQVWWVIFIVLVIIVIITTMIIFTIIILLLYFISICSEMSNISLEMISLQFDLLFWPWKSSASVLCNFDPFFF